MELNLDWRRRQSALWPEVSYEIRPLRVWAFQELATFWEAQGAGRAAAAAADPGGAGGAGSSPPSLSATARLMEVARRIFPEHVRGLSGLQVRGEGGSAALAVSDLCEETALLPLAAEIVAGLVAISALDGAAEKN
jgi:hypothetical protein